MRKFILFILVTLTPLYLSGCALVGTALSAAAAYGVYKALH